MPATRKLAKGGTQSGAKADGFTTEERAAMKERAKEVKAAKGGKKVDGTAEVLEKIAAMADADRVIAEGLHEIITKTAPELTPKTWYGMPAYARAARSSASSRTQASSRPATRPSASRTQPTSTTVPCGRRRLR